MKYSKILIFILSVILLIVVIKFMKGCRSKEEFVSKFEGDTSRIRNKLTRDDGVVYNNIVALGNIVNSVFNGLLTDTESNAFQGAEGSDPKLIDPDDDDNNTFYKRQKFITNFFENHADADYTDKTLSDVNFGGTIDKWWENDGYENWPEKFKTNLLDSYWKNDRIPKAWMLLDEDSSSDLENNVQLDKNVNQMSLRMLAINKFFSNHNDVLTGESNDYTIATLIQKIDEIDRKLNSNITSQAAKDSTQDSALSKYITAQAAKDSNQDTALSTYITSQVEKDSKQDTALSTYITSQVEKDSEQDTALSTYITSQTAKDSEQKAIDDKQNDIRNAFINTRYAGEIAEIEKLIKESSTDVLKEADFNKYKATQAVTDTTQDGVHTDLKSEFNSYSEAHTQKHSDLNEDISSYRTDHAMIHATEQTRVNAEFNDQDTALSKWEDIFKSAQVNLGIRIKCQNKKTGEWGKTPGEFCPDWFKASVPK